MFNADKEFSSLLHAFTLAVVLCGHGGCTETDGTPTSDVRDIRRLEGTCEVGCGQCLFGLEGPGCSLAIRWNGSAMFVDGSGIDDHGDAHAQDGLCNMIRTGDVRGDVKDGRFLSQRIILTGTSE